MTKEAYFEMCEALGTEPIESEIPVEFEDIPLDLQVIFNIYAKLKDEWDSMNGIYLGKSYHGILDIFNILEVPKEDHRLTFDIIGLIDKHRSENFRQAQKNKKPSAY